MGGHFSSHAVPRRLWNLHLAAREVECFGVSLGGELAVRDATLHGTPRVCVYWLASLYGALADAWHVDICERSGGHAESLVPDVFCGWRAGCFVPSRRGDLEFSMQMGAGGDGKSAAGGGAVWRAGGSSVQRRGDPDYY